MITEKRVEGQLETIKHYDMAKSEQLLRRKEPNGVSKLNQLCGW